MKARDWATVWEELPEGPSLESAFSGSFDSAPIGIEYFTFAMRVAQDDSGKGHFAKFRPPSLSAILTATLALMTAFGRTRPKKTPPRNLSGALDNRSELESDHLHQLSH